jgi:hypothetical protein
MPISSTEAFDQGVTVANVDGDMQAAVEREAEQAKVKVWFERIERSRQHDAEAYKQLARDRSYARGDSAFETKVNIIGSFIDTWVSLLYARDPDVDAAPAEKTGTQGLEDARLFAKTIQIVVAKLWRKAKLKVQAKPWTRAALTSKIGWLKVTWQEREGFDAVTDKAINDLTDNLQRIKSLTKSMTEQGLDVSDHEAKAEELRLTIESLKSKAEAQVVKGLCIDHIDMADITVSDEAPSIARYLDSPWISHRIYLRMSAAKAAFDRITEDEWKSASQYSQKKVAGRNSSYSGSQQDFNDTDASAYQAHNAINSSGKGGFVCVEEIWDRDTAHIITVVHGLKRYAKEPYPPNVGSSRFFPFFGLTFTEVDGERWAQSLNERSQSLQDAFSRTFQAFEEHRKRIRPKLMFQAGMMDDVEAKKLTDGVTAELVPVKTTNPKQDLRQLIVPVQYPQIDMGAYDVSPLMKQFELIWGLQEALTATIDVAKTATEAELQQSGTNSRTSDKRDRLEEELNDMAQYTTEIAVQVLDDDAVRSLAGVEAFWPEGLDIDDLDQLGVVTIRAGSSGKPNTKQMREAWASIMPLLEGLIGQIAQLRMSSPLEVADKLEELVTETCARSGEALDPQRFLPEPGQPMQLIDPNTMQPVMAYPAPQQPGQPPGGPAPMQAPGGPQQEPAPGLGDPAAPPGL